MKCPYCGGDCINKMIVEIYLQSVKKYLKYSKNESVGTNNPTAGEVGECKETGGRIYLCPYCQKPFKAPFLKDGKGSFKCPNCGKKLSVPVTNKLFC